MDAIIDFDLDIDLNEDDFGEFDAAYEGANLTPERVAFVSQLIYG